MRLGVIVGGVLGGLFGDDIGWWLLGWFGGFMLLWLTQDGRTHAHINARHSFLQAGLDKGWEVRGGRSGLRDWICHVYDMIPSHTVISNPPPQN